MKRLLILWILAVSLQGWGQTTVSTSYKWTGTDSFTKPLTIANATAMTHAVALGQMNTALAGKQNVLTSPIVAADTVKKIATKTDISRLEEMLVKIEAQMADTITLKKALIELLNKVP